VCILENHDGCNTVHMHAELRRLATAIEEWSSNRRRPNLTFLFRKLCPLRQATAEVQEDLSKSKEVLFAKCVEEKYLTVALKMIQRHDELVGGCHRMRDFCESVRNYLSYNPTPELTITSYLQAKQLCGRLKEIFDQLYGYIAEGKLKEFLHLRDVLRSRHSLSQNATSSSTTSSLTGPSSLTTTSGSAPSSKSPSSSSTSRDEDNEASTSDQPYPGLGKRHSDSSWPAPSRKKRRMSEPAEEAAMAQERTGRRTKSECQPAEKE